MTRALASREPSAVQKSQSDGSLPRRARIDLLMSAAEFEREVDSVHAKIGKFLDEIREKNPKTRIDEIVK